MSFGLVKQVNRSTLTEADGDAIRAVVLLGTLKKSMGSSTTYKLCRDLEKAVKKINSNIDFEYLHLATMKIDAGIKTHSDMPGDEFDKVHKTVSNATVVIVATPIWWGLPSSLIQKIIERFDQSDKRCYEGPDKASIGEGKAFGVVVTGAEDGAQACIGRLVSWASFIGFVNPPSNSITQLGSWGDDEWYLETSKCYIEQMAINLVKYAEILADETH